VNACTHLIVVCQVNTLFFRMLFISCVLLVVLEFANHGTELLHTRLWTMNYNIILSLMVLRD